MLTTIEELKDFKLDDGVETVPVKTVPVVVIKEQHEDHTYEDFYSYHNRFVNPLYRHCDLGGE